MLSLVVKMLIRGLGHYAISYVYFIACWNLGVGGLILVHVCVAFILIIVAIVEIPRQQSKA
jgi:hypothetical protein